MERLLLVLGFSFGNYFYDCGSSKQVNGEPTLITTIALYIANKNKD